MSLCVTNYEQQTTVEQKIDFSKHGMCFIVNLRLTETVVGNHLNKEAI